MRSRLSTGRALLLAGIAVFCIATACAEGRLPTDPSRLSPSVRLSLNATVSSAGRAMKLTASYAQAATPTVLIQFFTTTVTLTGEETELPIRIDIAGCVADPARELPTDVLASDLAQTCIIHIALSLLDADGKQIDAVVLPPISAKPGAAIESPPVVLGSVITSVALLPRTATINAIGFTSKLNATVVDNFGAVVASAAVAWTSLSPAVATVDGTGLVTARGVGSTRIVATSREKTDTATVTVRQLIKSVTITGAPSSIQQGDSALVAAVVRDSADVVIPPAAAPVTLSSSDPAVLTIDPATGRVRAIAVGTASLRASAGSVTTSVSVTVTPIPIAKVVVSPASGSVVVGQTFTYVAQPQSATGAVLPGRVVAWSSSDTTIASVSPSGAATAKRVGVATITATSEGVSGTGTLTVSPRPATQLVIATQPGGAVTGSVLAPQPIVQVRDTVGGVVTGSSAAVTVSLVGTGGALSGTTTVNAVNGIATFTNLVVTGVGGYTLTFTSAALTAATSNSITIAPRPATQLGIATQPGGAQTGSVFPVQPVVQVRNAVNGTVSGATTAITATLNGAGGTLGGTTTVSAVDGVATFTDLVVNGAGSYTITFSGGGLTSATSASITITPRPATKLAITTQPGGAQTGSPLAPQPVVQVRDAVDGKVAGATNAVTATLSGSGGTLGGTTTVDAVDGVATFTNLVVTGVGSFTVTFTSGALTASTSTTFGVTALAASQLVVATQPVGTLSGASFSTQPVVHVRDASNANVAGATNLVTASLAAGSAGTLSGTLSVSAVNAVVTFTDLKISGAGTSAIVFTSVGLASATSGSVVTEPLPPAKLGMQAQPGGAITGSPLAPQPVVNVLDADGGVVAGSSVPVTATLVGSGGTLAGTTTVTAVNGVATFTNLVVNGPAAYTLAFSSPGLAGSTSGGFTISPLPPTQLGISVQPGGAQTGSSLAPQPVVQVRNSAGATVAGATNAITATLNGSGASLSGTTTVSAVNGVATFSGLVVNGEGSYTLAFSSGSLTAVTSAAFAITPRPATQLKITTAPGGVVTGAPLSPQPVVQVQNAVGGKVAGATNAVTATLVGTGGTLSGTVTVSAVDGVASFTDLVVSPKGSYSLTFTAAALTSVSSTTFGITALAATQLVVATQPAGAVSGAPLSVQPVVHVRDASNAVVQGATNMVTATIGSGSGTLSGTTAISAVDGVATFTDLRITGAGTSTILFTATGLTSAASGSVVTAPPPAVKLAVATQPGGAIAGSPLSPQPVVQVQDADGGVVTGSSAPVTATLNGSGGTLLGSTTVSAVNGVATFTNLAVSGTGTFTLTFASTPLSVATSATFGVTPPPPTQLAVGTQPGGAQTASALAPQPVVEVRNAGGGVVSGATNAVTVSINGSGGTLSGTTTVSAVNGIATFNDLVITGAGSYTLTFASAGLTPATSAAIVITPLPASRLSIRTQPGGAIMRSLLSAQPVVEVQDASGTVVNTSTLVTATLNGAGGVLGGTTTATAVNGVATFNDLRVSAAGSYTLTFTASALSSATSGSFTVTPLPPALLNVRTQPGGVETGSPLAPQPTVEIWNDDDEIVAGATNAVTVELLGTGATLSGTLTVSAVNGTATFNDLVVTGEGTYQLQFTSGSLSPGRSASFAITPRPPTQLAIGTQPTGAQTGTPLTTQPAIQVKNAIGGVVAGNTAIVTATLNGAGGTLSGTTSVAAVDGVATFTNLVVTGAGSYTITFSSGALTPTTSAAFTITPPPPASIGIVMGADAAVTGSVGSSLAVPIVADMSNAQGQVLASLSLNVTWDPAKFDFVSVTNGSFGSSPSYFVNTSNAIYGSLSVSMFDNTGFSTGAPTIYTVTLRPKSTATGTTVTSAVTAAGDDVGRSIPVGKFIIRSVSVTTP
ncbi:hypothetical protein BH09GEM1_BH09GEM1_38870 [soil metagenome]